MFQKYKQLACCCIAFLLFIMLYPYTALSVENDECMDCHGDDSLERIESEGMKEGLYLEYNKFKYSVHNVNGITCVDCHSDIEELNYDNEIPHEASLAIVNCDGCHEEEGEAYLNSVHRKAKGKGISIPCYACHGYHYVSHLEADSVFERENGFCLKCHNPNKFHDWLPQKETHFAFVECTVCHAPEVPRYINLRFFDLSRNKFLSGEELLKGLNTDYDGFMPLVDRDGNGIISVNEFNDMILILRHKEVRGTFHGELLVHLEPIVHHVNRGGANRECEQCHIPSSPFFQDVQISLNKPDGTTAQFSVERDVLETYYVSHFYALGGTRIRLLDKIGLAMLVAGAGVVVAHLTARIVTIPVRRKRKLEEKV